MALSTVFLLHALDTLYGLMAFRCFWLPVCNLLFYGPFNSVLVANEQKKTINVKTKRIFYLHFTHQILYVKILI